MNPLCPTPTPPPNAVTLLSLGATNALSPDEIFVLLGLTALALLAFAGCAVLRAWQKELEGGEEPQSTY